MAKSSNAEQLVKISPAKMFLKRSEVVRAVAACTRKGVKRCNGMLLGFDDNAAVIVNQEGNPKGTRIFGPVVRELREYNFALRSNPSSMGHAKSQKAL
ncbi:hypothetical protein KP509_01G085600 [Ceratopteris richardii]|uniref:Ribosomal protein L14 n=1 Tax=Ceratopteris richardii TaxID=49495 RepID=A0A8T2VMM8_CERRI|nr:hypothetical protein KP509_01G085600 [Ceratopteris richardii]